MRKCIDKIFLHKYTKDLCLQKYYLNQERSNYVCMKMQTLL